MVNFDPIHFEISRFQNLPSGIIISPSRELSYPESALISKKWVDAVRLMANTNPLNLVTAPLFIGNKKIPDSYLSAGVADHFFRIGL